MMPGESDSLHLPLRAILLVPKHYNCVARARLLFSIAVSILCPRGDLFGGAGARGDCQYYHSAPESFYCQ